jgi:hypothetical protein
LKGIRRLYESRKHDDLIEEFPTIFCFSRRRLQFRQDFNLQPFMIFRIFNRIHCFRHHKVFLSMKNRSKTLHLLSQFVPLRLRNTLNHQPSLHFLSISHLNQLLTKSFSAFSKTCCISLSTVRPKMTDKFALFLFGTSNMRELERMGENGYLLIRA